MVCQKEFHALPKLQESESVTTACGDDVEAYGLAAIEGGLAMTVGAVTRIKEKLVSWSRTR
jgi:hypothetical protein